MSQILALFGLLMLAGCAVNPVTGERNLNFMSEDWERTVGAEQYAPLRQAQGGDFIVDPELTAYVQGIGDNLAAQAKRDFDWEFHILNDSTPNAWALPGGKIVVNSNARVRSLMLNFCKCRNSSQRPDPTISR